MNKKRFAPQYLQTKEIDRENFRIRFIFSSGVVDRHGEVIDQKGWKLDNYLKNPVVLWGHDQSKFPIGKAGNMSLENGKLEGDVFFAYNENPEAKIAFELCAGGFLSAGSVGFMNLKWMYDDVNDLLTLLENELFEFSIVNVPANPEALTKAIEGMRANNVDASVIKSVEDIQALARQKMIDRFKDLGEEVDEDVDTEIEDEVPAEKDPEDLDPVVTGDEGGNAAPEKTASEEAPSEDDTKKALDILSRSSNESIKASVKELQSRLNDASTVAAPAVPSAKKGLTNKQINRVVRTLLGAKENSIS